MASSSSNCVGAGTEGAAPCNGQKQEYGTGEDGEEIKVKNVLGGALQLCCTKPKTGFYRNGFCQTGHNDVGTHVVCAQVTKDFLEFSKSRGNDLMTPRPEYRFPGLKPGDKWCLCARRWTEAYEAQVAPPLVLESTHEKMLDYIDLKTLQSLSIPNYEIAE